MIRSSLIAAFVCISLLAGCGRDVVSEDLDGGATGGGTGTTGTGGSTGAGGNTGTGGSTGAVGFCNVQPVLQAQCGSCHGTNPVSGAPQLMTRAQLTANSPIAGTMLDRSITRMETQPLSAAMPPNVGGSASDVALLKAWRTAGLVDCMTGTGGGTGGGTGTGGGAGTGGGGGTMVATTCASNIHWSFGNSLGAAMNPGEACAACHTSQGKGPLDGFMGTVYPAVHEGPLCTVTSIPTGVTVEILDMAGVVRQTFPITAFSDGNFHGGTVGSPSPYRARVKQGTVVKSEMVGAQTNGDCNVCHTAQGAQGAPGRLHW